MGRYKHEDPDDLNNDPIVRCARSWIALKRSMSSFSFSETARKLQQELVTGRAWQRMRVYVRDTSCFQIIQRSVGAGAGACIGAGYGRASITVSLANVYDLYRANTTAALSALVGIALMLLGVIVLVVSGGGNGDFVDIAVGVDGCPNQADVAAWRHSCRPQWTGEIQGRCS